MFRYPVFLILLLQKLLCIGAQVETVNLESTGVNFRNSMQLDRDKTVIQFLSTIRGDPKPLSIAELNNLRRTTPAVAERFVQLLNHKRLLEDVSTGNLDKDTFDDLTKSLIFIETGQCSITRDQPTRTCLIVRKPIAFPKEPIISAHLSAFVEPRVESCEIMLKLHFSNHDMHQFNQDVFHLRNGYQLLRSIPSTINGNIEMTWDVTPAVADLQTHPENISYPVIMTLECEQSANPNPWDFGFEGVQTKIDVLVPDTQVVLELDTEKNRRLKVLYKHRRLIERSLPSENSESLCPSFLDVERQITTCCLFEYTLNKRQMDANPKLRFIIFPHHLPINICHGRCIGTGVSLENSHTILLNRYFSGLPQEEREVLYDSMPCCAANQTAPFTIVYKNQMNQLITETLPNAVKMSCACG